MIASARKAPVRRIVRTVSRVQFADLSGLRAASAQGWDITEQTRERGDFSPLSPGSAAADRHVNLSRLSKLRELCRAHDRSSALLSGIIKRASDNIFGANFGFRLAVEDDSLAEVCQQYIAERMRRHNADGAEKLTFGQICSTGLRAIWNDGDFLMVKQPSGSVQCYEADQVGSPSIADQKDKRIVLGVELDDSNKALAYWVNYKRLSRGDTGYSQLEGEKPQRIDSRDAWLPAWRTRFGQTRGSPYLASCLGVYDRLDRYVNAETLAAEINAMLALKITQQATEAELDGVKDNADADEAENDLFEKVQKFRSGMTFRLLNGEDVSMIQSSRPGGEFEPYVLLMARIIGAAVGLPLELVLLDFSKTSWSSARANLIEARRTFRAWQKFAEDEFVMPWYRWQIARGIALRIIPPKQEAFNALPQWPGWQSVDPVKEAEADGMRVRQAQKSISACIRETGGDPQDVWKELASDIRKLQTLGIPVDYSGKAAWAGPDKTQSDEDEDEPQGKPNSGRGRKG